MTVGKSGCTCPESPPEAPLAPGPGPAELGGEAVGPSHGLQGMPAPAPDGPPEP